MYKIVSHIDTDLLARTKQSWDMELCSAGGHPPILFIFILPPFYFFFFFIIIINFSYFFVDFRLGNRPCGLPTFLTFTFSFRLENNILVFGQKLHGENKNKRIRKTFGCRPCFVVFSYSSNKNHRHGTKRADNSPIE